MEFPLKSLGPALDVLALLLLFMMAAAGIAVTIYLAMLPGRIARRRGHPQAEAVNILGWLGLPAVAPWVGALVWAYWRPRAEKGSAVNRSQSAIQALRCEITKLESAISRLEQTRGEASR
ncbi:DUF3302 domain-containing protein [Roseiconus nitratireducens]|uniref:DUF3302 domain-containing protein n=1 Tax=Roseiconus nitratireducens TaxID=2605748 RepID=A0A5M6D9U4_9BACT|nr:DUF3302 domain-containing protein [Roseiconus nitratireducens]